MSGRISRFGVAGQVTSGTYFDFTAEIQENVVRLEVSVDAIALVKVIQTTQHLVTTPNKKRVS